MAKYGSFKYSQAKYGLAPYVPPTDQTSAIIGTPSLSDPRHFTEGDTLLGVTSIYVDSNKDVKNNPFKISDTENTILNANRDEAIQGATELSTIAMGEKADPNTEVDMVIQGLVKITIPYAGSRFSRN